jgi:hypothetical protein
MERAHVFFESLDSFMEWKSPDRPVYAIQLYGTEQIGTTSMTRVTYSIHISQLFSDVIHHCLIRTSVHLEPLAQHERDANRQKADRAWAVLSERLDDMFEICVLGGQVSYPKHESYVFAALPESLWKDIDAETLQS